MKKNVFAIDGLCASGKGTISKQIANYFKIPYLNTGALYRAIGYHLYKQNFTNFQDINSMLKIVSKIDFSDLENPEFFTEDGGKRASNVSKIPEIKNDRIRDAVFDMNVMGGAGKTVQRTLNSFLDANLVVDGDIGNETIKSINAIVDSKVDEFIIALKTKRIDYLKGTKNWVTAKNGWTIRTNKY
jgi:cytidylate kinase